MQQHFMRQWVHNGKQNRLGFCPQRKGHSIQGDRKIKTNKHIRKTTTASWEKCAEEKEQASMRVKRPSLDYVKEGFHAN